MRIVIQRADIRRDIRRGIGDRDRIIRVGNLTERGGIAQCLGGRQRQGRRAAAGQRDRVHLRIVIQRIDISGDIGRRVGNRDDIVGVRDLPKRGGVVQCLGDRQRQGRRRAAGQRDRAHLRIGVQRSDIRRNIGCRVGNRDRIVRVRDIAERSRIAQCLGGRQRQGRSTAVGQRDRRDLRIGVQRVNVGRDIRRGIGNGNLIRTGDFAQRSGVVQRLGGRQRQGRGAAVGQRDRGDVRISVQRVDIGRDIRRRVDNADGGDLSDDRQRGFIVQNGRRGVGNRDRVATGDLAQRGGVVQRLGGRQRQGWSTAVGQPDRSDLRIGVQRVNIGRDVRRGVDDMERGDLSVGEQRDFVVQYSRHRVRNKNRVRTGDLAQRGGVVQRLLNRECQGRGTAAGQRDRRDLRIGVQRVEIGRNIRRRVDDIDRGDLWVSDVAESLLDRGCNGRGGRSGQKYATRAIGSHRKIRRGRII